MLTAYSCSVAYVAGVLPAPGSVAIVVPDAIVFPACTL